MRFTSVFLLYSRHVHKYGGGSRVITDLIVTSKIDLILTCPRLPHTGVDGQICFSFKSQGQQLVGLPFGPLHPSYASSPKICQPSPYC